MNAEFLKVISHFKPNPVWSHTQIVTRSYRKALRYCMSWSESRETFNAEATKIRARFTANKNVPLGSAKLNLIMRELTEELAAQRHPDPYITNYMPGGTLYMRNPTLPMEYLYPEGIPEGVSRRRVNVDMSYIPDDQEYADKVFVDSVNKTYWIDK